MGENSEENRTKKKTNKFIQKMFIKKYLSYFFLTVVNARVFGSEWGWVFKPNGLNTLVSNECVTRRSVYLVHNHSKTRGSHVSRMLGHVATRETSRAILDVIRVANGHSPVSCTSEEVQEMEQNYQNCHTKMQYKLKCFSLSKDRQCLLINNFLEDCTKSILGKCFDDHYMQYIYNSQKWSLSSHHLYQELFSGENSCFDEIQDSSSPRLEPTTTVRSIDRGNLLRRYLRHPAISKYKYN